jgi:hypothetical protein
VTARRDHRPAATALPGDDRAGLMASGDRRAPRSPAAGRARLLERLVAAVGRSSGTSCWPPLPATRSWAGRSAAPRNVAGRCPPGLCARRITGAGAGWANPR